MELNAVHREFQGTALASSSRLQGCADWARSRDLGNKELKRCDNDPESLSADPALSSVQLCVQSFYLYLYLYLIYIYIYIIYIYM